ncbi:MAG: TonB-dependent receptor plug domain-containing protein [Bacteroidales bacterium]
MRTTILFILLIGWIPGWLFGQTTRDYLEGRVLDGAATANGSGLPGANVFWQNTSTGTSTDIDGHFKIQRVDGTAKLIVSYVGYQNDTLDVGEKNYITVSLSPVINLDEVEVTGRRASTSISSLSVLKVEQLGEKELLKAACCNLSESFETTPGIDVSYTDAVTGTRQIQMLGLAGPNIQIMRENMPDVRGLSAIFGLTYIPGTWVERIDLNKGTGSVVNGFESIAGQINTELRKPENTDRLYINLYGNEGARFEANAHMSHRFRGERLSTALLFHTTQSSVEMDRNLDGFADHPVGGRWIALNRWKYIGKEGYRFQAGIKGTRIDQSGGQLGFDPYGENLNPELWGMHMIMSRMEGWAKVGRVFEDMPWKSFGFQVSGVYHNQESNFGTRIYNASQQSFYANLIYQTILGNTNHTVRTGASFQYDDYRELFDIKSYDRIESVPGAFFEYSYSYFENFNLVAGLRADYHNLYGAFLTPRLHLRYAVTESLILRATAGRGLRSANIFSENVGLLASSRLFIIQGLSDETPYGLDPEIAWNSGINLTWNFHLAGRDGRIGADFYRTDFQNQIVADIDLSPQQVVFYNLEGTSRSNSLQIQVDYEPVNRLDVRVAYRWFDVKTTYHDTLMEKPLLSPHRAFINVAWESANHWKLDGTLNWQGSKRIPSTASNPEAFRREEKSPSFVVVNFQVTKIWNETFEVYAGGENLFDFRQPDPIIASDYPFSPWFDSSMIWGPVFGRNIYAGIRYKIKYPEHSHDHEH